MRLPRPSCPDSRWPSPSWRVLADRALVGQAESARAAAVAGASARTRGSRRGRAREPGQLEQEVAATRPPAGLRYERLRHPAAARRADARLRPYGERSRGELAELLSSDQATPSGLPEAVVARLVLGPAPPVSGAAGRRRPVEERLLDGELPVRAEDLRLLASRLGVAADPRVAALEERLRRAPNAQTLPGRAGFRASAVRDRPPRGLDARRPAGSRTTSSRSRA